jgi:exodeoxyribonuclease X
MSVLIFDTETTGKDEGRQIVEAAWLQMREADTLFGLSSEDIGEPLSIEASFCRRFKPAVPVTFGSMAVHHILPDELEACDPSGSFALPPECRYIVGHAVDFDWITIGSPNVKRICTHAMSQHCWPDADSHGQSALLYMLNGATVIQRRQLRNAHSALADAENCLALLEHILLAKTEIRTWSALWEFSEAARIPIYCPMKRWDGQKLTDMDDSSINWCLRQDWLDPYLRKGFERVLRERYPPPPPRPPREPAVIVEVCDDDIPF